MSIAEIQVKRDEAVTAVELGDYETAVQKLEATILLIDTTPDTEKDHFKLTFDRQSLVDLLGKMQRRLNGKRAADAGGMVRQPIRNVRECCSEESNCCE